MATLPPNSHVYDATDQALFVGIPEGLVEPQRALDILGGTIKIVEVLQDVEASHFSKIPQYIAKFCLDHFEGQTKKVAYGVSVIGITDRHEPILKKSLNYSKKALQEAGIKSRYINKDFQNPQSAALLDEQIIEKGLEMVILKGNKAVSVGKTVALQNINAYSERDYRRPERDARQGMLPPKLAQMMLNISGVNHLNSEALPERIIYDPFCGVGTVLTEAYRMGYSVLGSDIIGENIKKTDANLQWTRNQISIPHQTYRLFLQNASFIKKNDLAESISAIVSETYLGPPMSRMPNHQEVKDNFGKIEETLLLFFESIHNVIASGTPIVVSLLAYRSQNRYISMDNLVEKIFNVGFHAEDLIPAELTGKFKILEKGQQSIIYERPDQIVCRQIWKFVKN